MELQMITLPRGIGYIYDNFVYVKDKEVKGRIYLKCQWRKRGCKGRVTLCAGEVKSGGGHDHPPPDLTVYDFKRQLKEESKREQNHRLSVPKVYENVRAKFLEGTTGEAERMEMMARLPEFKSVQHTLYGARSELLPTNPKKREDLDLSARGFKERLNINGSNFVVGDSGVGDKDRILVFSSEKSLSRLSKAQQWHVDGTFWVVPFLFYQLFSIHCFVNGQMFPLVYGLLPDKKTATYVKFFKILLSALTSRGLFLFDLTTVVTDFEPAIHSAVRAVFPYAAIRGCYFHFSQVIYRQVSQMGMAVRYKTDAEFRLNIRKLIALGLVPADRKTDYMQALLM